MFPTKKFSIQNPFMLNVVSERRKNFFLPCSIIWTSVRPRTATREWYLTTYLLLPASCSSSFAPTTRDLVLICAVSHVGNLVALSFTAPCNNHSLLALLCLTGNTLKRLLCNKDNENFIRTRNLKFGRKSFFSKRLPPESFLGQMPSMNYTKDFWG